ncbi:hypothetical protein AB0E74_02990 [Streptomyces sp. NPDC030392]|uniref:hypothetical protein n=1 Tax=Streptomyces sp. NPDC030392 TaxID=3155468 RepID=UPI0033ED4BF0
MKTRTILAAGAAAATLILANAFPAHAGAQASGTVKVPYQSGKNVYAEATLHGPNAAGTKLCVYLNAQHPYVPDVTIASKCATIDAGTVRVSAPRPACGNYTTWAAATYKGRTTWQAQSLYKLFC